MLLDDAPWERKLAFMMRHLGGFLAEENMRPARAVRTGRHRQEDGGRDQVAPARFVPGPACERRVEPAPQLREVHAKRLGGRPHFELSGGPWPTRDEDRVGSPSEPPSETDCAGKARARSGSSSSEWF